AWLQRLQRVCDALEQQSAAAKPVADAFRAGHLDPIEITARVLAGDDAARHALWEGCGLEPDLADVIVRYVLFPVMTNFQEQLAPVHADIQWSRGYCPVCGSWPVLGEFRGL